MDTLYIIIIAIVVVLAAVGVYFLNKKFKANVFENIDVMKTVISIIKTTAIDMGVNKDEVNKIADIVLDTLEYMKILSSDISKEEKISIGFNYAKDLCYTFEIKLDKDKEFIIENLIKIGFNIFEELQK